MRPIKISMEKLRSRKREEDQDDKSLDNKDVQPQDDEKVDMSKILYYLGNLVDPDQTKNVKVESIT